MYSRVKMNSVFEASMQSTAITCDHLLWTISCTAVCMIRAHNCTFLRLKILIHHNLCERKHTRHFYTENSKSHTKWGNFYLKGPAYEVLPSGRGLFIDKFGENCPCRLEDFILLDTIQIRKNSWGKSNICLCNYVPSKQFNMIFVRDESSCSKWPKAH